MNPEQPLAINSREAKHLRTIITLGLVLLLVAILAAYIYYGMRLASKPIEEAIATPDAPSLTADQAEIIKALENAPLASPEETEAVFKALDSAPTTPETDRQAVLDALR